MLKFLVPTYRASSLFSIDPAFFLLKGVKIILSDLDNTLDGAKTPRPSQRAIDYVKNLSEKGITLVIVSNNTSKRVQDYSAALGVRHFSGLMKPLPFKLKKLKKTLNCQDSELMVVGDQILTDVIAASLSHLQSILLDPLITYDPPWTKFNRFFERPLRAKIKRANLAPDWREVNEQG